MLQEHRLEKIGGKTVQEHIEDALLEMFSFECAAKCTWKGQGQNNFRVEDLKSMKIMEGMNYKYFFMVQI